MTSDATTDGDVGSISEALTRLGGPYLPGRLGIRVTAAGDGWLEARLEVEQHHLAPNGFLHGGAVTALADTACGYGCARALPAGARGFTTVELKANLLGTATTGEVVCTARLLHGGRSTQVWDAAVNDSEERTIAVFRCTQLILRPG